MENNEIMQMLMEDETNNTSPTSKAKNLIANHTHRDEDLSISRVRVVTAKYKIFIMILAIVMIVLYFVYIPEAKRSYNWEVNSYNNMENNLRDIESKIKIAQDDKKFLAEIVENEATLKDCLNNKNNQACASLKQKWHKWTWTGAELDYTVPLSFQQLQSLHSEKMSVDEKRVLKNLNEYLIKHDITWWSKEKVWEILRISIWETENLWNTFFSVLVEVSIEFTNIDDLVDFLYNIEKKMIESTEDRILYKIQSVSYDIISNDEPQITDIAMIAYYYYDERFDDAKNAEKSANEQKTTSNTQTNQEAEKAANNQQKKTSNSQTENSQTQTTTTEKKKENKVWSFFSSFFSN